MIPSTWIAHTKTSVEKELHNLKKFCIGNGYVWGRCLVFGMIYCKGQQISIAARPYKSRDFCHKNNRKLYTQVELDVQIAATASGIEVPPSTTTRKTHKIVWTTTPDTSLILEYWNDSLTEMRFWHPFID